MSINVVAMTKDKMIDLFEKYAAEFGKYFGSDVVHNLCGNIVLSEELLGDKELYKAVDYSLFTMSSSLDRLIAATDEELDSIEKYVLRSFELAMRDIYVRLSEIE